MAHIVRRWLVGWAAVVLSLSGVWTPTRAAVPQTPLNLLANGSLETPYYAQGAPTRTVPHGWSLWIGAGAPESVPNKEKPQVLDGAVAWAMQQNGTAFTSAGYQQVAGLTPGDRLRLTASGWAFTCDDPATACLIPDPPYRRSDAAAGVALKVGIDPAGGTDPLAGSVHWSAAVAPYDQWAELSVSAAAEADTVTVFLYATQTEGLALNSVYWDQAALVIAAEATPEPDAVTFVVPQSVRPDGSLVHIIQAGDTLWSIAYAYTDYGVTVDSIAALNEGIKPTTRYLTPGDELIILPPGSVDPATGLRVTPGAAPTATPFTETPAAPSTATPSPTPTFTPTVAPPTATATATATATVTPTKAAVPAALAATSGTLCVELYEDTNANGVRDADEGDLSGGTAIFSGATGEDRLVLAAGETSHCAERAPGQYTVQLVPPDGYGLTTADTILVELAGGRRRELEFGAAQGYSLPPLPTADGPVTPAAVTDPQAGAVAPLIEVTTTPDSDTALLDRLYDHSGLIVLGLAGVIGLGSALAWLALRRPR